MAEHEEELDEYAATGGWRPAWKWGPAVYWPAFERIRATCSCGWRGPAHDLTKGERWWDRIIGLPSLLGLRFDDVLLIRMKRVRRLLDADRMAHLAE